MRRMEKSEMQGRDVLKRALAMALEDHELANTPLAAIAHEILALEIQGIDDRSTTQGKVVRKIRTWAEASEEWLVDLPDSESGSQT